MRYQKILAALGLIGALSVTTLALADDSSKPAPQDRQVIEVGHNSDGSFKLENQEGKFRVAIPNKGDDGIIISLGLFLMVVTIVWLRQRSRERQAQLRLEAIKVLADKGQTVNAEMLPGSQAPLINSPAYSIRKAYTHFGLGVGLTLFFLVRDPHSGLWAIGIIFLCSGVGHFLAAKKA